MSDIASEVARLLEISRKYERPGELIDATHFEITDILLAQLREVIGDTGAFQRIVGRSAAIGQELTQIKAKIVELRMFVVQVAEATQKGMQ